MHSAVALSYWICYFDIVWISEIFCILMFCLVTPERLFIFRQLAGVQYVYLSQNAERTLLGHLSASAIFNNLLPCRCKNSTAKIVKLYEYLSNIDIKILYVRKSITF